MTAPAPAWTPGLLSEPDAALWLGISASTLRGLGIPRRVLGRRRLYDVRDLIAYRDGLPYEGDEATAESNTCDAIDWAAPTP